MDLVGALPEKQGAGITGCGLLSPGPESSAGSLFQFWCQLIAGFWIGHRTVLWLCRRENATAAIHTMNLSLVQTTHLCIVLCSYDGTFDVAGGNRMRSLHKL